MLSTKRDWNNTFIGTTFISFFTSHNSVIRISVQLSHCISHHGKLGHGIQAILIHWLSLGSDLALKWFVEINAASRNASNPYV